MSESLRDQLTAAFDQHVPAETPPPPAAPAEETPPPAPIAAAETPPAEPKDERPRDPETGKFLPKDAAAAEPGKSSTPPPPAQDAKTAPAAAAPVAAAPKPPRPSSWGKDKQALWASLTPEHQAYIGQREREYATGVSTYKTEAERAKGIMGALQEFAPLLQRHNIDAGQWIGNLGRAHVRLATGSPQDKVQMGLQLIRDYQIDPNALFQALTGQAPAQAIPAPQPQQPPQPQFTAADIARQVDETLAEREAKQLFASFQKEVQAGKYPHFTEVEGSMKRILNSGLAQDYAGAYSLALALPEHAELRAQADQQAQAAEAARQQTERAEAEKQKVARARSQAVSVRSSTPSTMTQASSGTKSLRDQISEAFDATVSGARV